MKHKRVDLSKLTPDQRAALAQFSADARAMAPQMAEMKQMAQAIYAEWLKSPQWQLNEGQPPAERPSEDPWRTGPPEIRYVDEFERPQRP